MNINDLNRIFEPIDRLDESGLRKIVNSGIHLNIIHELREQTPLICAINNNWLKGVKIMIEAGVDVNQDIGPEVNPLLCAVYKNNVEIVEILLKNGADKNGIKSLYTPLNVSIAEGKICIAQALIQRGADVNYCKGDYTPLMYACAYNNLHLVKILIAAGSDPNIVKMPSIALSRYDFEDKITALVVAAERGCLDIFEYLLPLTIDEEQKTLAYESLPEGILDREKQNNVIYLKLFKCARYNDVQVMEKLIDHGVDINQFLEGGENALHIASRFGNLDIVNLLIKFGANLNILSLSGSYAMKIATINNHPDIVTSLIKAGANLAVEDGTLLMLAAARNCIEVAKVLIYFGIDINAKDSYGETALEKARKSRNVKMIEFLKEAGAVGRYDIEPVPEGEIPF